MRIGPLAPAPAPAAAASVTKPASFKAFQGPDSPQPAVSAAPVLPAGPLSPPSPGEKVARQALTRMLEDERKVDKGLGRAMAGQNLDAQSLLVLQVDVMRYSQEVDLASRLVDRVAGDIKQIMQTQV